jgi:hypothetical protein
VRGDLPGREALRSQREDQLVDTVQAALALADDLGLEGPVPVTGHVELDRADLGHHRLRSLPVARIRGRSAGGVVFRVAEVLIQLALERGLQHPLGQPAQQTAGPGQGDPVGLGLVNQPLGELGVVHGPLLRIGH